MAVNPKAPVLNEVPCGPLSGELEVIVYPDADPPIPLLIFKVSFTFPGGAGADIVLAASVCVTATGVGVEGIVPVKV